jgi:hypothetical protein
MADRSVGIDGDEGKHEVVVGAQALDQLGLGHTAKGSLQHGADRGCVHRTLGADRGNHARRVPAGTLAPRRNSSARIG